MGSKWYWRDGTLAVDFDWHDTDRPKWEEAMKLMNDRLGDRSYKIVAQTLLDNGYKVSTVWLGLDHSWTEGEPLIFESMVFKDGSGWEEQDMKRYSTEEEAINGHNQLIEKWKKK